MMIRALQQREEAEPQYLPARMLNEFAYCPRLFYLEHVEGLFAHNEFTKDGESKHQRVDQKSDALPKVGSKKTTTPRGKRGVAVASKDGTSNESEDAKEKEILHARSVTLASDHYGLIAKMDLVESDGETATPVDYKRGKPRQDDDGNLTAWDPERIQVCAQALVLRENGYQCHEAIIFFWETKQRVRIAIDDALIELTENAIQEATQTMQATCMPLPLVNSPKCPKCSLVGICLPEETSRCRESEASEAASECVPVQSGAQRLLFDVGPVFAKPNPYEELGRNSAPIRQMITVRDERKPLYLNTQGLTVGISSQVLQIREKGRTIQTARLKEINQVNLFGAVQVSTQAIQALLRAEIPLVYFSFGGWFHGMTQPVGLKNIMWRREQFRMADRPAFCLQFARSLIAGKIRNQRTLLMRNHIEPPQSTLRFLKSMIWEAERVESLESLLGIEGMAARSYFEQFAGMLKVDRDAEDGVAGNLQPDHLDSAMVFDFTRRNRRPPRDPVNAMLSLGYSLLAKDLTITSAAVGLDPFMGFFHQPRFGRPALALDLMEPFRSLVVDSAVLSAVNQRMVTQSDFIAAGDSVALTVSGRRSFFQAYEQRMDQLITHPLFGYRVSYRRLLEIQTRLLARHLLGEIREYPVFVTR